MELVDTPDADFEGLLRVEAAVLVSASFDFASFVSVALEEAVFPAEAAFVAVAFTADALALDPLADGVEGEDDLADEVVFAVEAFFAVAGFALDSFLAAVSLTFVLPDFELPAFELADFVLDVFALVDLLPVEDLVPFVSEAAAGDFTPFVEAAFVEVVFWEVALGEVVPVDLTLLAGSFSDDFFAVSLASFAFASVDFAPSDLIVSGLIVSDFVTRAAGLAASPRGSLDRCSAAAIPITAIAKPPATARIPNAFITVPSLERDTKKQVLNSRSVYR